MAAKKQTAGTKEAPWKLKTPPGTSEFEAYRDETLDPPALVVQVGKTERRYHLRCLDDLSAMLTTAGDWIPLGSAAEQKPAAEGASDARGRAREQIYRAVTLLSGPPCPRAWATGHSGPPPSRGPGIQSRVQSMAMDSGFASFARAPE